VPGDLSPFHLLQEEAQWDSRLSGVAESQSGGVLVLVLLHPVLPAGIKVFRRSIHNRKEKGKSRASKPSIFGYLRSR
jgi:hypothetical protein